MEDRERLLEEELIERAKKGDRKAFLRLWDRYAPRLKSYMRLLPVAVWDEDDLVQEVWEKACFKLKYLQDGTSFQAWLFRIAKNEALMRMRRKRPLTSLDGLDHEPVALDNVEDAARLNEYLERLHKEHREVFVHYLEDMTYDEIAKNLGIPMSTVRSRLRQAKLKLERLHEEEERE